MALAAFPAYHGHNACQRVQVCGFRAAPSCHLSMQIFDLLAHAAQKWNIRDGAVVSQLEE